VCESGGSERRRKRATLTMMFRGKNATTQKVGDMLPRTKSKKVRRCSRPRRDAGRNAALEGRARSRRGDDPGVTVAGTAGQRKWYPTGKEKTGDRLWFAGRQRRDTVGTDQLRDELTRQASSRMEVGIRLGSCLQEHTTAARAGGPQETISFQRATSTVTTKDLPGAASDITGGKDRQ